MIPVVALVGRPNTGKSSLFNRLLSKKHAIIANEAGTTRDRVYMHAEINDHNVILIDTGGLSFDKDQTFDDKIADQTKLAISEADVILFTIDVSEPLTSADHETTKLLRKAKKPVILVANKSDHSRTEENLSLLYRLGFADICSVSAIHNLGISQLEDKICKLLPKNAVSQTANNSRVKIGFIGKPNVGKSSLVNKLLGREQVIVSDVSGTTRDSTHLDFEYENDLYTLVDTAGIRRRGKQQGIEKFGVMRTLKTIEEIDIAVLVLDGTESLAKQDLHVAEFILEAHKGLILVVNKADQIKPEEKNKILAVLQRRIQFANWAPVIFTSALTGSNITKILELTKTISLERNKHIDTSDLNFFLKRTLIKHPPQSHSTKKPKIQFVTQADGVPPTFVFFCKNHDNLHFSYKRYLENKIRETYGFGGTAIKMVFKERRSTKDDR